MNLSEQDRKFIWHPFTPQKNMPDAIPIVKGEGSLLIDENGKTYIDAISSWWVNLHGHAHPYIAKKIYQQALQLEQVIFAGFTHKPAVELAQRLLQILPGNFSKIFYSDNGSTSTEVAIKMAIQYWWNREQLTVDSWQLAEGKEQLAVGSWQLTEGKEQSAVGSEQSAVKRKKILAFNNGYHGDTFGAMSVSDRGVFTLAFHDLFFEVIFIDTPSKENLQELKSIIQQHAEEIAAFIYEPLIQGAGGMKMYDTQLMNELLGTIQQHKIICIADEVMTGFGRTGKLFASEYMEHKPDIICLSKGLTGGTMALGVTACNEKIYSVFVSDDKLKTFFHGHSFTANPLACTAALASLDLLLKDECMEKIEMISAENKKFVRQLSSVICHLSTKNIRTLGTIFAFEIDEGKDEYLNNISSLVTSKSLDKGVYLRPLGNTVYIMPPYCITKDELQKVYATILSLLNET